MGLTTVIKDFFSPLPRKKVDFRPSEFIKDPPKPPSLPSGVVSSGFTPDTLRDAINDAKAVRATALANAQSAMNGNFSMVKPSLDHKPNFKISIFSDNDSKHSNSFSDGTVTDSHGNPLPAPLQYNSFYGGTKITKASTFKLDDIDKKHGIKHSGAVDTQPKIRTGKIARIELDVIIGSPLRTQQIYAINNSLNKEIYLASNHSVVQDAVNRFNEKLREMYCGKVPVWTILNGTPFRMGGDDLYDPALDFDGLSFMTNGAKITASFSCGDSNKLKDIIEVKKQLELVGKSCEFFILGDMELDEQEENITEMYIECFGYINNNRMKVNKELFRIL